MIESAKVEDGEESNSRESSKCYAELVVCLLSSLACSRSAALDTDRTTSRSLQTAWGPKVGLPDLVRALAQTGDRYLWRGSLDAVERPMNKSECVRGFGL